MQVLLERALFFVIQPQLSLKELQCSLAVLVGVGKLKLYQQNRKLRHARAARAATHAEGGSAAASAARA